MPSRPFRSATIDHIKYGELTSSYNRPLEERVSYDPHLIVGILGGSAGTTRDAFQLIHDARKYGARVALYGRKINLQRLNSIKRSAATSSP